jgi:PleD family two-component response regulator
MAIVVPFPRMPNHPEQRRGKDRRISSRGGRRDEDRPGFAPLVLVADDDADSSLRCEAILAKLRFAVAPAQGLQEATRIMGALRPDVVVARMADIDGLRLATPSDVPLIALTDDLLEPEALINEIRRVLRGRLPR